MVVGKLFSLWEGNFLWAILVLGMVSSLVLDTCFSSQGPFPVFPPWRVSSLFRIATTNLPPSIHQKWTFKMQLPKQQNHEDHQQKKATRPPRPFQSEVYLEDFIEGNLWVAEVFLLSSAPWDATLSLSVSLSINIDHKEGYPSLTMYILERILWV